MRGHGWRLTVAAVALASILPMLTAQSWEEEKEPKTQALVVLPEPPASVTAESTRLIFGVTPPRTEGLLSKQTREIVKSLSKSLGRSSRLVRLRAFVAGSGDTRRVQEVVGEIYSKRRQPTPTLSVVQVGRLPVQGSQVVFEYIAEDRKEQNPNGVAFVSGQEVSAAEPTLDVEPLARQSLAQVRTKLATLGTPEPEVVLVTCYCSSLMDGAAVRKTMTRAFPGASVNLMQLRRSYTQGSVSCDAVARLMAPATKPPRQSPGDGVGVTPNFSEIAVVGPGQASFTSSQLAFRHQDSDIRLAFERLGKVLEGSGTSMQQVVKSNIYPISLAIAGKIQSLGFEYFDKANPPASTLVEMEGLPSMDASFAVDVVALIP